MEYNKMCVNYTIIYDKGVNAEKTFQKLCWLQSWRTSEPAQAEAAEAAPCRAAEISVLLPEPRRSHWQSLQGSPRLWHVLIWNLCDPLTDFFSQTFRDIIRSLSYTDPSLDKSFTLFQLTCLKNRNSFILVLKVFYLSVEKKQVVNNFWMRD